MRWDIVRSGAGPAEVVFAGVSEAAGMGGDTTHRPSR